MLPQMNGGKNRDEREREREREREKERALDRCVHGKTDVKAETHTYTHIEKHRGQIESSVTVGGKSSHFSKPVFSPSGLNMFGAILLIRTLQH